MAENISVPESDTGRPTVRASTREPQLSEKGHQYKVGQLEAKLKRALSSWRRQSIAIEELLSDSDDIELIRKGRDSLTALFNSATSALKDYTRLVDGIECEQFQEKFEVIEIENQRLSTRIATRIGHIQAETQSSKGRSSHGRVPRTSHASRKSNASLSSNMADAAADAAALTEKLKFLEIEESQQIEIEQRQLELEMKKRAIEKTHTLRDLKMAEARITAISKVEATGSWQSDDPVDLQLPDGKDEMMKDFISSQALNPQCQSFIPINQAARDPTHDAPYSPSVHNVPPTQGLIAPANNANNRATIQPLDQLLMSRLPPPEPSVFSGDPLEYPSWKSAFHTLIESRAILPGERIYYLKRYLSGAAKETVEGYFLILTDDSFKEATRLLDARFGDPFVVANAFRDKLEKWPKVAPRDGLALRKLADFLRQCTSAMKFMDCLNVLNDHRENRKILMKLPDWLVNRWARSVVRWKTEYSTFPPFTEFSKFVSLEADIACDPITSLQTIQQSKASVDRKKSQVFVADAMITSPGRSTRPTCTFCDKNHALDDCRTFLSKPLQERKTFAMQKSLCFGCMEPGHRSKDCKRRKTCKVCSKRHPSSLHGDVRRESREPIQSSRPTASTQTSMSNLNNSGCGNKSSMVVPVFVSHRDRPNYERLVYALLDTQSDTTFVLGETCDLLGVKGTEVQLSLSTMSASNQLIHSTKVDGLRVRAYDSDLRIALPSTYTRDIIPANRAHIPTPTVAQRWPHLMSLEDKLLPLNDCEVGLLIGYDCTRALAPREVIPPVDGGPYGQRTDLGWGIVGITGSECDDVCDKIGLSHRLLTFRVPPSVATENNQEITMSLKSVIKEVINPNQLAHMMELDFKDDDTELRTVSCDDRKFLAKLENGIHKDRDGHYEMPLPFRDAKPSLPNNKPLVDQRLLQLKRRLERNPDYHSDYTNFMANIIKCGFAEPVPESEMDSNDNDIWYIPHHGVYNKKNVDKIRVVFDCSATFKGHSLNQHLLQGPDLTNALVGVLCRFRKNSVAFICDVEQMFHQFKVNPGCRNYLRFLWWGNGDCTLKPSVYRMCVHLFGASSSPGCANFGLKQAANDGETDYGSDAAQFVRNDFYVDDGLKSVPTVDEAVRLISNTKGLLAKAGLRIHKFLCNSMEVIQVMPKEDLAKGLKDLGPHESLPMERALGVQWCMENDVFQFRIILKDLPLTRRGVLATICSVYDPLGFIAPVILQGKMILQQLCRDHTDWDTPLSENLRIRWENWRTSLLLLDSVKIKRCVKPDNFGDVQSVELHHFSDACTEGYAQSSYIRLVDDRQTVHCSFVMGKSRVTPIKQVTIPRLELTAALLSAKISKMLDRELQYPTIKHYVWTDSQIVLGYIKNESRRFHVFVANRVQQIRDLTDAKEWRHVASTDNPADCGSRGVTTSGFDTCMWLCGPNFLRNEELLLDDETTDSLPKQTDPEVRKAQSFACADATLVNPVLLCLESVSDWHRAKRVIVIWMIFKERLRKAVSQQTPPVENSLHVDVAFLRNAELEIFYMLRVKCTDDFGEPC